MGDEPAADAGLSAAIAGGFAAGARVGLYRLERQLGRGGMAVVYLAHDERLGRLVALKIIAPERAADEAFRTRFIRESHMAAAVDHPHIIPVFDAGDAGGLLYIAMRFVSGGDVGAIVRRDGLLSPARAAGVIAQVASALDAAHAIGLVHRDVKPANMLVDAGAGRSDHVYLSDFGVSKMTLAASTGLTGTGQILGTWDYVAPEQIQGWPADGWSDQCELACAAFELMTGAPPFRREEASAVLYAHLSEPPPPVSSRREDLPPEADPVFARALAKAPHDRYSSCQEFADALLDALSTAPRGVPSRAAGDHPPTQYVPVSDSPSAPRGAVGPSVADVASAATHTLAYPSRRSRKETGRRLREEAELGERETRARSAGRQGNPAGARDQLAALLLVRERVSGPEGPPTLSMRAGLAFWTGQAGDPASARDQLAALLPVRERVSGPEDPETLNVRYNLAFWTGEAGDPAAARDQFAALLPVRERALGTTHPDTTATRRQFARWTEEAGDRAGTA